MHPVPTRAQVRFVQSVFQETARTRDSADLVRQFFTTNSSARQNEIKDAYISENTAQILRQYDLSEFLNFFPHDNLDKALQFFQLCRNSGNFWVLISRRNLRLVYNTRDNNFALSAHEKRHTFAEIPMPSEPAELTAVLNKITDAFWKKQIRKYMFVVSDDIEMSVVFTLSQHRTVTGTDVYNGTILTYSVVGYFRTLGVLYTRLADFRTDAPSIVPILQVPVRIDIREKEPMIMGAVVPLHNEDMNYYETSKLPFDSSRQAHEHLRRFTNRMGRHGRSWNENEIKRHWAARDKFKCLIKRDAIIEDSITRNELPMPLYFPFEIFEEVYEDASVEFVEIPEEEPAPVPQENEVIPGFWIKELFFIAFIWFFWNTIKKMYFPPPHHGEVLLM